VPRSRCGNARIVPDLDNGFEIILKIGDEESVPFVYSYKGSVASVMAPFSWKSYAVAAAAATVLAEHSGTQIVDPQSTFTKEDNPPPDEFARLT
jgi:hypothetical protein